jgi:hypothetical protein
VLHSPSGLTLKVPYGFQGQVVTTTPSGADSAPPFASIDPIHLPYWGGAMVVAYRSDAAYRANLSAPSAAYAKRHQALLAGYRLLRVPVTLRHGVSGLAFVTVHSRERPQLREVGVFFPRQSMVPYPIFFVFEIYDASPEPASLRRSPDAALPRAVLSYFGVSAQ